MSRMSTHTYPNGAVVLRVDGVDVCGIDDDEGEEPRLILWNRWGTCLYAFPVLEEILDHETNEDERQVVDQDDTISMAHNRALIRPAREVRTFTADPATHSNPDRDGTRCEVIEPYPATPGHPELLLVRFVDDDQVLIVYPQELS